MTPAFCIQNVSSLELHFGLGPPLKPGMIIDLLELGLQPQEILRSRSLAIAFSKNRLAYIQKPNCLNHTLETLKTPTTTNKLSIVDIEHDYIIEPKQDIIVVHGNKDITIQLPSAQDIGTTLYIKKYNDNTNKITLRTQPGQTLDLFTHRYPNYDTLTFSNKCTIHLVAAEYEWLVLTNSYDFFVITDDP